VQEIEGAIRALADRHARLRPFLGVILVGEFTGPSLRQLTGRGFNLIYFETASLVKAFAAVGIDAHSSDATPEAEYAAKIAAWASLSPDAVATIQKRLLAIERREIRKFCRRLDESLSRRLVRVTVIGLHGQPWEGNTIVEAVEYVRNYREDEPAAKPFAKFEVLVRYSNNDTIDGIFQSKADAIDFLTRLMPVEQPKSRRK
jgi:hypothetical protein